MPCPLGSWWWPCWPLAFSLSLCVLPPCPQLHLWSHSSFFLMGIPCYSQVVLSVHFLLVESQEFNSLPSLLPGEGNDNPLQYSCLENPVDGGAWWAAVYGVTKSWTRLKWLSMCAHIGEGNGNPLQCSCLENPRDGGAWWAAVYGVAQSRTQLKQLSSSSSITSCLCSHQSKLAVFLLM